MTVYKFENLNLSIIRLEFIWIWGFLRTDKCSVLDNFVSTEAEFELHCGKLESGLDFI